MSGALIVPTLAAGPFQLRAFEFSDLEVVREASIDALIPLITTATVLWARSDAAAFAVASVVQWAHQDLQIPRLELYVEPWNLASIRTAEMVGFRLERLLRGWQEVGGERKDMFMYARLSADPRPRLS
jgi:hypothetical protein